MHLCNLERLTFYSKLLTIYLLLYHDPAYLYSEVLEKNSLNI